MYVGKVKFWSWGPDSEASSLSGVYAVRERYSTTLPGSQAAPPFSYPLSQNLPCFKWDSVCQGPGKLILLQWTSRLGFDTGSPTSVCFLGALGKIRGRQNQNPRLFPLIRWGCCRDDLFLMALGAGRICASTLPVLNVCFAVVSWRNPARPGHVHRGSFEHGMGVKVSECLLSDGFLV